MRAGVNILNFGPGVEPESFLRWAQVSEGLGYHSVMISDHVAVTPGVSQRYPEPFYDAFATLSWLAGQTSRIQLGTTIIVLPYRHPALIARLVANLDQLSGGRFIFGVGVGNAEDEFKVLGVEHAKRGAIANEDLRIMLALWNSAEPVTLKGRYYEIDQVQGIPTKQKPHPPVWVGGASDGALLRAVRYGQAWHPNVRDFDQMEHTDLPKLKAIAANEGKPIPALCPRMRMDIRDKALDDSRVPGSGSLEQVQADIARLERLGTEHVTLDWYTGDVEATKDHERGWNMLALLASQVLDLRNEKLR